MLVENLQRSDLTAVEEADGYQGLLDLGLDEKAIAARTGRSRATVAARLRLVPLPEKVREAVHEHVVTLEQATEIGDLPEADQRAVIKTIGSSNFTAALTKARTAAELDRKAAPLIKALSDAGATELPKDTYSAPPGLVFAGSVSINYGMTSIRRRHRRAAAADHHRVGLVLVLRVHPHLPAPHPRGGPGERRPRRARRRRPSRARGGRRSPRSRGGRRPPVRRPDEHDPQGFLTATLARKLTTAHTAAVLDFASTYLVALPWSADGPTVDALTHWTGATTPDGFDNLQSWQQRNAWERPVHEAASHLAPANRALAALAAAMEPVTLHDWRYATEPNQVHLALAGWYALLEQLGYQVSDAERAALVPKPAEADDDEDEDDFYDAAAVD